jgi:hypothetical protein
MSIHGERGTFGEAESAFAHRNAGRGTARQTVQPARELLERDGFTAPEDRSMYDGN